MTERFWSFFNGIPDWPIWQGFYLIQSQPPTSGNIFGFAEYLASLALFLVVITASDFRYRYRLSLTKTDLRKAGFWVALSIGTSLLLIDLWFQNGLPIPNLLANSNNLKAALALVLLGFVSHLISVAVIHPPLFTKRNAKRFLDVNYHYIHEGNVDRLQVIAEELKRSVKQIIDIAANAPQRKKEGGEVEEPYDYHYASDLLLLIGDRRFCRVVVDKVPTFALICFQEAQRQRLPLIPFGRNIGQEFIRNTSSSFYHEISGYDSGLVGHTQPVTNTIYGNYEFVEHSAHRNGSPLESDYRDDFNGKQIEAYARASLAFFECYLKTTSGKSHSQALIEVIRTFEYSLGGVYKIDGVEDYHKVSEYDRLRATVDFIKGFVELVEAHAARPKSFRISKIGHEDVFDRIAQLIFETILAASTVTSPVWTAWAIQHNTVWYGIFGARDSSTIKIIALKVRRLIYAEIMLMDSYANFKGASLLGYCLNVLGVKLTDRHNGYGKEFYPLQAVALNWVKANYKQLLADHPKVAQACLQGSVSYDADNHRLVKTYSGETAKEPSRDYFDLSA